MYPPRIVLWDMQYSDGKGYIPCAFTEGGIGYAPLTGNGPHALPWYWGDTSEECQARCDAWNEEMGIDRATARAIVLDVFRKDLFGGGHA